MTNDKCDRNPVSDKSPVYRYISKHFPALLKICHFEQAVPLKSYFEKKTRKLKGRSDK